MAGASSNDLRSAYVAETTPGTIVATPAFTTSDVRFNINATPSHTRSRTQWAGGAMAGQAVNGYEVGGSVQGSLIYGNYDGWLESLLQGAWSTNVLKDGKATKSFSVENTIPAGAGGTATMLRYRGVEATSGVITAASGEDVNFSFDLMGMGSDASTTTAITGATYTDPTNVTPLAAGLDVGTITMAGYTLNCFNRVEMNFAYEDRDRQRKVGSNDLCGLTRGAIMPTIRARMFVEANFAAIFDDARINHTAFAVTVPLGSVSGSKYTVEFPECYFGPATTDFGSADAMLDITINAAYDTTEDCVVKITRAVS